MKSTIPFLVIASLSISACQSRDLEATEADPETLSNSFSTLLNVPCPTAIKEYKNFSNRKGSAGYVAFYTAANTTTAPFNTKTYADLCKNALADSKKFKANLPLVGYIAVQRRISGQESYSCQAYVEDAGKAVYAYGRSNRSTTSQGTAVFTPSSGKCTLNWSTSLSGLSGFQETFAKGATRDTAKGDFDHLVKALNAAK